jgi:hypothetical protein
MSSPQSTPEQLTGIAQGYVDEYGKVFKDAAKRIDEGTFSWDDRIKLLHRLIELQLLGAVAVTQAAIKGPCTAKVKDVPKPSAKIDVTPDPQYTRQLTVAPGGSFIRLAPPSVAIPDYLINFMPDVLAAKVDHFRIGLRDSDFTGFLYRGTVRLRNLTTGAYEDKQVTVGL